MALGAVYISSGVDDDKRSLALPLDRIIGVGAGVKREIDENKSWRLNLNYYDLGDAPVDTEPTTLSGRIVGKYDKKHALGLDFSFMWSF